MLTRTQMYRLLGTYGEGLTEGEIDAIFKWVMNIVTFLIKSTSEQWASLETESTITILY